jgi:hypothetical protein
LKNLQKLLRFQGWELGHGATLDERSFADLSGAEFGVIAE